MGRTLPYECPHGNIVDWGDFGPEDEEPEDCPQCELDQPILLDYWHVTAAIGRAFRGRDDSLEYWELLAELKKEFPEFDWHNAITDHT